MSNNQGSLPGVDDEVQLRKGMSSGTGALVSGRAVQPMGARDTVNARVPGFEDITDQPDWCDSGFSGHKSDLRVVRFERLPETSEEERQAAQGALDTDA